MNYFEIQIRICEEFPISFYEFAIEPEIIVENIEDLKELVICEPNSPSKCLSMQSRASKEFPNNSVKDPAKEVVDKLIDVII